MKPALFLLLLLVVMLCLGIILSPWSIIVSEPVSDGRG